MKEHTLEPLRLTLRVLRFRTEPQREEPALLAQSLLESGQLEDALQLTADALARDPSDAELWLGHGVALARLGRVAEAQRALVRAAEIEPEWAEPWRHLAEILLRRDRPEQALAVADRALAMERDDPQLMALRRSASLTVRVRRFTRRGAAEEPAMLAQELMASGRVDDALEVTRTALLSEVDDVDLLVTHARAARARGDLEEALGALSTASFEAPDWPAIWRERAEVESALGLRHEALVSVRRALELEPGDLALFVLYERLEREASDVPPQNPEVDRFLETLERAAGPRRSS